MKCPYCGEEMASGYVSGDRYALKFYPDNYLEIKDDKLLRSGILKNYIQLSQHKVFVNKMQSDYCTNCKILISQVKDFHNKK